MEIKVRAWDKWQTYRKDRGAPPWIKLHRNLMSNKDWAKLSDAEKGQLCSMWIVAADKDGTLPSCPSIIRKICQLDAEPNINKFTELGFFDAKTTPRRRQPDANVTHQRRDREETEEKKEENPCPSNTDGLLSDFEIFWNVFGYKVGKEEAKSSWKKIKGYTPELLTKILSAAEKEKERRKAVIARGATPKMAQGWITGRRWEDEQPTGTKSGQDKWERIAETFAGS